MNPVKRVAVIKFDEVSTDTVCYEYWNSLIKLLQETEGVIPMPNNELTTPALMAENRKFNLKVRDTNVAQQKRKSMKTFSGNSDKKVFRRYGTFTQLEGLRHEDSIVLAKNGFILDTTGCFLYHTKTGLSRTFKEDDYQTKIIEPRAVEVYDNQISFEHHEGWNFRDLELPEAPPRWDYPKLMEGLASLGKLCFFQPIGMIGQYYVNERDEREEEVFTRHGIRVLGHGIRATRWHPAKGDDLQSFLKAQRHCGELESELCYNADSGALYLQDPKEVIGGTILHYLRSSRKFEKFEDSARLCLASYIPKTMTPDEWRRDIVLGDYKKFEQPDFRIFHKKFFREMRSGSAKTGEKILRHLVYDGFEHLREKGAMSVPESALPGIKVSVTLKDDAENTRLATSKFRETLEKMQQ